MSSTISFWVARYYPKLGDVVVDVGAGCGEDLHAWSKLVGPDGRVFAIEADPMQYSMLLLACERNVVPIHCAAVDKPQVVWIEPDPATPQSSTLSMVPGVGHPCVGLPLDMLLVDVPSIALLKMNIEGAETLALPGAVQTLRKTQHVVIAAHDFRADRGEGEQFRTHAFVMLALASHGFKQIETIPGWYHVHARKG